MKNPRLTRILLPVAFGALGALGFPPFGPAGGYQGAMIPHALADEQAPGPDAADLREIQSLYGGGSYDAALKKLSAFYKAHPGSALTPQARNLHGLIFILTKRPQQAIHHFERSLEASDNDGFKHYVRYNLAAAQFESGFFEEARGTLSEVDPGELDRANQVKLHSLRAKTARKLGAHGESIREFLKAVERVETTEAKTAFVEPFEQALESVTNPEEIASAYREHEDSALADLLLYKLGVISNRSGQFRAAESHFKTLVKRFPQSRHYAEAQDALRAIENRSIVEPRTVGVLLPMKGKFSKFGMKSLQAISLAFRMFNPGEPPSPVKLVIEDSGEDVDTALQALDRLYFKHHVIAVIGPLLSKGIDQVTLKSQELGLPLITLSQQGGITGDSIFQAGFTPQLQAHEIARHAIEKLGHKRFAILSPRDKFGEAFTRRIWDAVESLGGEIVGAETYAPGETDFRQAVDKLSGLHYQEARAWEQEELAALRLKDGIKKRNRKTEGYFALKPIVDYDAVFIPDEPKVVGQILPTFAYRDVTGVQFLGINTWNSPELVSRAQRHAEGAQFTEAFYPDSASGLVRKFVKKYQETYKETPSAMEALAYDAASLVEIALGSGAENRSELAEGLRGISNFPGVTGRITWMDGIFNRNVTILEIKGGQIVEAKDPKETPAKDAKPTPKAKR